MRTRNNSVFEHFSSSVDIPDFDSDYVYNMKFNWIKNFTS